MTGAPLVYLFTLSLGEQVVGDCSLRAAASSCSSRPTGVGQPLSRTSLPCRRPDSLFRGAPRSPLLGGRVDGGWVQSPGPLRRLRGDPRAAARAGTRASRLRDRRRRPCPAVQCLWPGPSHHWRRLGRARGHGARLDPAGEGARRVAARHLGPHVRPDAADDRPTAGSAQADAVSAPATAAAARVRRLDPIAPTS